jgi:hypothetical protein
MRPEEREAIERADRERRLAIERQQREEEQRAKELERLGLSALEKELFRFITTRKANLATAFAGYFLRRAAVETLYRVKWDALGPVQRRRCLGKLRARLHALNCKLKRDDQEPVRIPGCRARLWPPPATRSDARTRAQREREALAACEDDIREALAVGEMNSWDFMRLLCDQKGHLPGTVKKARKRLRIRRRREGYGGDGGWVVSLPPD